MKHILSVLVENKSGVLSRVTGMISRRGFNIESLTVAPTERSHDEPPYGNRERRRGWL